MSTELPRPSAPRPPGAGECPPLDTLVAHFSGMLLDAERRQLQAHLAVCAHCRGLALELASSTDATAAEAAPATATSSSASPSPAGPRVNPIWRRMAAAAGLLLLVTAGAWMLQFLPGRSLRLEAPASFSFNVLGQAQVRGPGEEDLSAEPGLRVVPGQILALSYGAAEDAHVWIFWSAAGTDLPHTIHRGLHQADQGVSGLLTHALPDEAVLPARSFLVALAARQDWTAEAEQATRSLLREARTAAELQRDLERTLHCAVSVRELIADEPKVGLLRNRAELRQQLGAAQALLRAGDFAAAGAVAESLLARLGREPGEAAGPPRWEEEDLGRTLLMANLIARATAEQQAGWREAERLRAGAVQQIPLLLGAAGPAPAAADLRAQCREARQLRQAVLPAGHPLLTDLLHLEAKIMLLSGGPADEAMEILEVVRAEYGLTLGQRHPRYADALNDLAGACRSLGLHAAGILYASDALRCYEQAHADPRQTFEVMRSLADMHARLGSLELARSYAKMSEDALQGLATDSEYWARLANAHVTNAGLLAGAGDEPAAQAELERALELYEEGGDARRAATVRCRLADLLLRSGSSQEARELLLQVRAADVAAHGEGHVYVALDDFLLGQAAMDLRDLPEAQRRFEAAFRFALAARGEFHDLQDRAAASHAIGLEEIAAALSRVHHDQGELQLAFRTLEQGRARILMDLLLDADLPPATPDASAALTAAQERIDASHEQVSLRTDESRRELALSVRDQWMAVSVDDPRWRQAMVSSEATSVEEATQLLGPGEIMLYYSWSERSLLLYVLDAQAPGLISAHVLADGHAAMQELAGRLELTLAALESGDDADETDLLTGLHRLGLDLLPPALRGQVLAASRLCVVPDGALARLPLETLVLSLGAHSAASVFLLDQAPPITCVPSASVLALLRARHAPHAAPSSWSALLVGDPAPAAFSPRLRESAALQALEQSGGSGAFVASDGRRTESLPELPESGQELELLSALMHRRGGGAVILAGDAATPAAVLAGAPGCRFLHIAAHGTTGDRLRPETAGFELSPALGDSEASSSLSLQDILTHWRGRLAGCELAVLSSCSSGRGGDGAFSGMSLPLGFHSAGVPAVVASAWQVDSAVTLHLMCVFFDGFLGAGTGAKPAALLAAKRIIRSVLPHPYHWAAFQYHGDPN